MRLAVVALVFAAVTGAIGFSGVWMDGADYVRVLSALFFVVGLVLLIGSGRRRVGD